MKNPISSRNLRPAAFTLVEMLVVIAIIALLAGIVIPLAGLASKKKIIARAQAQIKFIELAIDQYKNKLGFYPPDNTNAATPNQLFYELLGATVNSAGNTFSNSFNARDSITTAMISSSFSAGGIVNSSPDATQVQNFLSRMDPNMVKQVSVGGNQVWVLVNPTPGPGAQMLPAVAGGQVNPICYQSSNPTNNANSGYDLWVDVIIGGATNRISNWSLEPQIVH